MDTRRRSRRYLLVVFVAALFVAGAGVTALAQPDEGDVYTGCLNQNSGALRNVAVGFEPVKACNDQEAQITWDRSGPAFDERITALEERVDELEDPYGHLDLFVDCAAGDTVGDALTLADTHPGPVSITISGVCEENVGIERSDVSLSGLERSDGISGSAADGSTVFLGDVDRVGFFNMTITGGSAGIEGGPGASFMMDGVTVQEATVWGVLADAGATADLRNCVVESTSSGAGLTTRGGAVRAQDCLITGNQEDGLKSESGGTIIGFTVDVVANGAFGATAGQSSVIELNDSTITDNSLFGVFAGENATVSLHASLVANNGDNGAQAGVAGVIHVVDSVVEDNNGHGLRADRASTLFVEETTIRGNVSDGVALHDQSNGVGGNLLITDNGGYGINCAGPPGFPEVQNGFDMAQIQFSGNTNGDTNCP